MVGNDYTTAEEKPTSPEKNTKTYTLKTSGEVGTYYFYLLFTLLLN